MTRSKRSEASEADTLKTITEYLEILQAQGKLLYLRHSPSNVVGKKGEATFRRPRASQLGSPDLIVFRRTYVDIEGTMCNVPDVLCIEVKSAIGKQSRDQHIWEQRAINQGCRYLIARSLEDVRENLR